MFFKKKYHKKDFYQFLFFQELDSKFWEFKIFPPSKKYLESNAHTCLQQKE
jgi:hypothetical protein